MASFHGPQGGYHDIPVYGMDHQRGCNTYVVKIQTSNML